MNHIQASRPLRNTYYAMRHGTSLANEEGIILSDPERGVSGYGLTATGRDEARASAENAQRENTLDSETIIVSSDFARARETAEILADTLGVDMVITTPKLRERFFGSWDGKANTHYQDVWKDDASDATHTNGGVESVAHVLDRATELIAELEQMHNRKNIVLTSHGDTLQILQTAFAEVEPTEHRSLSHLHTAEIRALN